LSSYRTYEEWKPSSTVLQSLSFSIVLTVPMRNGNFVEARGFTVLPKVLTVPMRNGNVMRYDGLSTPKDSVLTVPMRNGNSR